MSYSAEKSRAVFFVFEIHQANDDMYKRSPHQFCNPSGRIDLNNQRVQPLDMSKLDRIKAEISFHEKMFFTAIAMMLGLLGWAANNYLATDAAVLYLAMIGLIGAAGFGV